MGRVVAVGVRLTGLHLHAPERHGDGLIDSGGEANRQHDSGSTAAVCGAAKGRGRGWGW